MSLAIARTNPVVTRRLGEFSDIIDEFRGHISYPTRGSHGLFPRFSGGWHHISTGRTGGWGLRALITGSHRSYNTSYTHHYGDSPIPCWVELLAAGEARPGVNSRLDLFADCISCFMLSIFNLDIFGWEHWRLRDIFGSFLLFTLFTSPELFPLLRLEATYGE